MVLQFHRSKKPIFRQLGYSKEHLLIKRASKWLTARIRFQIKTFHPHSFFKKTISLSAASKVRFENWYHSKILYLKRRSWLRLLSIYCFFSAVLLPYCRLLWTKPAVLQVIFPLLYWWNANEQVQLKIMRRNYILTF